MVNKNELEVVKKYEEQGWKTLRGGAPDFVFLKVNNGEIQDILFVEVKSRGDWLTYEQDIYRKVLEKLNAKYKIETIHSVPNQTSPPQPKPSHTDPIHSMPLQAIPHQPVSAHPIPDHATPDHSNPIQTSPAQTIPYHSKGR